MSVFDRHQHWEKIYQTKELKDVSWYQSTPHTSLEYIRKYEIPASASIIDVGGGDSLLVDHLLNLGYENVSVLDISENAIDRAKKRLGKRAVQVEWIVSDVNSLNTGKNYDFWHDRATFHFLTEAADISRYQEIARQHLKPSGIMLVGTFSPQGPKKCSGIEIRQYSAEQLTGTFSSGFNKLECRQVDHPTPFDTVQNFTFCSFRRILE